MVKRFSTAILVATILLFGGAVSSVGAAANESGQVQQIEGDSNVYYSVHGQWGDWQVINDYLKQWSQGKWNQQNSEPKEATTEQPKNEEAKEDQQIEQTPEQTDNDQQIEQLSQFERQVVELTNAERTNQGLAPLEADPALSKVAREKSNDMATQNYFDHNSPTYGSPFEMMKSHGVSYTAAGENIAKGQQTPESVVEAWMNSQGHRENILSNDFSHIGVGYVEQGNHWTQMFIKK